MAKAFPLDNVSPTVLSGLGHVVALCRYPAQPRVLPRDFGAVVSLHIATLAIILLLLLCFVRSLRMPWIYRSPDRSYAFVGFSIGLSIAHGIYRYVFGLIVVAAHDDPQAIGLAVWYFCLGPLDRHQRRASGARGRM